MNGCASSPSPYRDESPALRESSRAFDTTKGVFASETTSASNRSTRPFSFAPLGSSRSVRSKELARVGKRSAELGSADVLERRRANASGRSTHGEGSSSR